MEQHQIIDQLRIGIPKLVTFRLLHGHRFLCGGSFSMTKIFFGIQKS